MKRWRCMFHFGSGEGSWEIVVVGTDFAAAIEQLKSYVHSVELEFEAIVELQMFEVG